MATANPKKTMVWHYVETGETIEIEMTEAEIAELPEASHETLGTD